MMARRLVIVGICLAVIIAAVAIVLDQMAKPGPSAAQNSASSSSPSASGTSAPSNGAATQSPGSPTSDASASGPAGSGETPAPTAKPLEVLPPVTASPTGLPAPTEPAPLVTELPDPGSAQGELVDGWPGNILVLPPGTTIASTGISVSGDRLQLTADGIVDLTQDEVLGSFTQSLAAHGFWTEPAPAVEGAQAARFVRGTDTVTVSVSTTGTGASRFQLLGSLHTTAN
ncbi:hypothetical protein ACIQC5_21435 [Paenarthrobacter sp. NPDC092416]|uniref:hypothetical protein n=1 Tax=Paenarthrobacter sp. NPDC092416 TaxID=3364386 RepID=UPI003804FCCC